MNIGFIVDASSKIGLGHWSRCINIAKILNKKVIFFSDIILQSTKDQKI